MEETRAKRRRNGSKQVISRRSRRHREKKLIIIKFTKLNYFHRESNKSQRLRADRERSIATERWDEDIAVVKQTKNKQRFQMEIFTKLSSHGGADGEGRG